MKIQNIVSICLIFAAGSFGRAQSVDFDKILDLKTVADVRISPDGSKVAYVVREVDFDGDRYGSHIWVRAVEQESRTHISEGSAPRWSPDGRGLAFLAAADGNNQIWQISLGKGEREQITDHPGGIRRFGWSPDGRFLAYLADHIENRPTHRPIIVDVNDLRFLRLWVVDVVTRKTKSLTPSDFSVTGYAQWFPDGFSWSPESRKIVFGKRPNANRPGAYLDADVAIVDIKTGQLETVVGLDGMDANPRWSPDGKQIAFIRTPRDWVLMSDLYVMTAEGGEPILLSANLDEHVKEFHWSADGSTIFFTAGAGVAAHVYSLAVPGGRLRQLSEGTDVHALLSISRDGRSCAFTRQSAGVAADVYFSRLDSWAPKKLTGLNPQAGPAGMAEVVRYPSFDGMEIEGLVHKPPQYQEGKRYPLVVRPHGGPQGAATHVFVGGSSDLVLLRQGWILFRPNFRGSGNYGERFLRANRHLWGYTDFKDIMSGVDYLIDQGMVDPDRMATMGSSYGGYMSSWAITRTDRFKAAGIGAAMTNFMSLAGTTDVPSKLDDYLGKNLTQLLHHSPMNFVTNASTPSLIWHGEKDLRVPVSQAHELYKALKKKGVPVSLVIYPGQGHGIRRPSHQKDLMQRQVQWLNRWVLEDYHSSRD